MTSSRRVASITVTFEPDAKRLARQIEAVRAQVDDVIVVDNGSRCAPAPGAGVDTIPLGEAARASNRIRQLSVAELLAETIRRIAFGESVSSLYVD